MTYTGPRFADDPDIPTTAELRAEAALDATPQALAHAELRRRRAAARRAAMTPEERAADDAAFRDPWEG